MKLSFDYKKAVRKVGDFAVEHQVIGTFLLATLFIGLAFARINSVTTPDVNENRVKTEVVNLQSVQFNEEAIEQIESLRDSNVNVDPNFQNDRNNPFSE